MTVGYEALTRFADGVPPDIRFGEAHAVGLGLDLEAATMSAAMAAAESLPETTWLNVNASPAFVLAQGALLALVKKQARRLVIEVTEHAEIQDYDAFRAAIGALGPTVGLAVDDAGAGYASLRHILELQPAFVKIRSEERRVGKECRL